MVKKIKKYLWNITKYVGSLLRGVSKYFGCLLRDYLFKESFSIKKHQSGHMIDNSSAYRAIFKNMIKKDDSTLIENNDRDHALVIIQELIESAEKEVVIQCSSLSEYIYGNPRTIVAIKNALNRGVSFKVNVRSRVPESVDCFILLYRGDSEINLGVDGNCPDFCVVDRKRYRRELDRDRRDAVVCANDEKEAKDLLSYCL